MDKNDNTTGVFAAAVLSMIVIVFWKFFIDYYYPAPQYTPPNEVVHYHDTMQQPHLTLEEFSPPVKVKTVRIQTKKVQGDISLQGALIDQLILSNYNATSPYDNEHVSLLSPKNSPNSYYTKISWHSDTNSITLPDDTSIWEADQDVLSEDNDLTLTWNNGQGLLFSINLSIDDGYMFTVKQSVKSINDDTPFSLGTKWEITKINNQYKKSFLILHEGPIGYFNGDFTEINYKKTKHKTFTDESQDNWAGISDKYWATVMIPKQPVTTVMQHTNSNQGNVFKVTSYGELKSGSELSSQGYIFAGAKELDLLDHYTETLNIRRFDRLVDFGIMYFITKPVSIILKFFHKILGNFGLAILLLTICVKLLALPISLRASISMHKMKMLQPRLTKIKEMYKNDRAKLQQKTMSLLKRNKVNVASGCLPTLLQIPIFFSLYKVLFVTLYMRHAPFYFWIVDLSSPDPLNIIALFGLLKFDILNQVSIGVLPIILGFTMWIQNNLRISENNTSQESAMKYMPLIFVFVFSSFPAGLVIYWIWSNLLAILQQSVLSIFLTRSAQ